MPNCNFSVERPYSKLDLSMLDEVVEELQPSKVERLWIAATKAVSEVATADVSSQS
jgi:hypothetical protein